MCFKRIKFILWCRVLSAPFSTNYILWDCVKKYKLLIIINLVILVLINFQYIDNVQLKIVFRDNVFFLNYLLVLSISGSVDIII